VTDTQTDRLRATARTALADSVGLQKLADYPLVYPFIVQRQTPSSITRLACQTTTRRHDGGFFATTDCVYHQNGASYAKN